MFLETKLTYLPECHRYLFLFINLHRGVRVIFAEWEMPEDKQASIARQQQSRIAFGTHMFEVLCKELTCYTGSDGINFSTYNFTAQAGQKSKTFDPALCHISHLFFTRNVKAEDFEFSCRISSINWILVFTVAVFNLPRSSPIWNQEATLLRWTFLNNHMLACILYI